MVYRACRRKHTPNQNITDVTAATHTNFNTKHMIGKIAKDVRSALHVKQEEFAYKLGISREYYSKIENGKVQPNHELTLSIINTIRDILLSQTAPTVIDVKFEAVLGMCDLLTIEQREKLADSLTHDRSD